MARWQFSFLLLLLFVCGCGSTGIVARITVTPGSATLGALQTQQFFAAAYDSVGNALTRSFSWSVSGGVGTIDASSGLFYAGTTFGSGSVSAVVDGVTGSATVSITNNGTLTGRLTDAAGNRIPNIRVSLISASALGATSDTDGLYAINNIPAGTYEVQTGGTAIYIAATAEVAVTTASTTTRNITLAPRFAIENYSETGDPLTIIGTLRNDGSTLALGITITIIFKAADGTPISSVSQALGNLAAGATRTFTLTPLPPLSPGAYATKTRTVSCASF